MRKVTLSDEEMKKYEVIKKLVETNGSKQKAATKLGCTIRHINRLIKIYKEKGKEDFIHGNKGKLPATTIPLEVKNQIIKMFIEQYNDANYTHFCEIVEANLGYKISDTTLNKWLLDEGIISPKARRTTRDK